MNGRRRADEREQGGSSNPTSNLTVENRCEEGAPSSDGIVDGHVPISVKRSKHIKVERQRRVQMKNLLDSLQELLPDHNPRKDQCSLLTNTIAYIQSLEEKTKKLTRCKEGIANSLSAHSEENTNNTLDSSTQEIPMSVICFDSLHMHKFKTRGHESQLEESIITFTSSRKKGIFSQVLWLFNMNKIKVVNASSTSTPDEKMLHFIHAQVPKDLSFQINDLKAILSRLKVF